MLVLPPIPMKPQAMNMARYGPNEGKMNIKINTHGNPMPEVHGEWVDLFTAEDVMMTAGEARIISLGVSMQLPKGYYAQLLPRSSTCMKWGIQMGCSIGIIENSYCGDNDIWGFPAVAFRDTMIPAGTRIAQFTPVKQAETIDFQQTECLGNPDRGGFGSTGTK